MDHEKKKNEYKKLCIKYGVFMEYPADKETPNLLEILKKRQNLPFGLVECINFSFQILKAYEIIDSNSILSDKSRYFLNIKNWFMDGNVLRTDNFHHINSIKYRTEDFEKHFRYYKEENNKGNVEKLLLYDVALLFIRLLTGEFLHDPQVIKQKFFVSENKKIYSECEYLILQMLDFKSSIRELTGNFLKIYKNHVFSLFLDESNCSLYQLIANYTYGIHEFLKSLKTKKPSKPSQIKTNLILGYFVLFLRNIVTMPINYFSFSRENFIWVEEFQQYSDLYEEYYDIYYGTLSLILEEDKSYNLKPLTTIMNDFNKKNILSLRQVETIAQSYQDEEIYFKRFFSPFKNYERDIQSFRYALESELKYKQY